MALTAGGLLETRDAFDGVAGSYDASNAANPVLQAMRTRAVSLLREQVAPGARLLELGCGPGTDTRVLLGAGYSVTAIDWAPAMAAAALVSAADASCAADLTVHQLGIHELGQLAPLTFDAAFSNFGPLNCVPDLEDAARLIAARLRSGGLLVASVIGRVCPWEIGLFLWRRDRRRALIRFERGFVPVPLAGRTVWTRYYTPAEFERAFAAAGMTRVRLRALGLCTPPPYLEGLAVRRRRLMSALQWLDDRLGAWPGARQLGDHFLVALRKD